MFKRCRVVRLSTNEKASKIRLNNKSKLSFEPHIQGLSYDGFLHTYQHLYILSDDEIKEGDWCYDNSRNEDIRIFTHVDSKIEKHDLKKIIATTDSSLNLPEPKLFDNNVWWTGRNSIMYFPSLSDAHTYWCNHKIPSPSQSFIDKYVSEYNKGNIITDVMVEYSDFVQCKGEMKWYTDEQRQDDNGIDSYYQCKVCGDIRKNPTKSILINSKYICDKQSKINFLKVDSKDSTITIKKIKDSWGKEEVEQQLVYCVSELAALFGHANTAELMKKWNEATHEWAKNNL